MEWVAAVVEWARRIAGIVKLALRLEDIERRVELLEGKAAPRPENLRLERGVWVGCAGGREWPYCPACASGGQWIPLSERRSTVLVCPKCEAVFGLGEDTVTKLVGR